MILRNLKESFGIIYKSPEIPVMLESVTLHFRRMNLHSRKPRQITLTLQTSTVLQTRFCSIIDIHSSSP